MPKTIEDRIPMELQASGLQKGSVAIANLLITDSPKHSHCKSSPDTILKSINTILTQMLAHSSPEVAQQILQLVASTLKVFIESILGHSDIASVMDQFLELYKKDNGQTLFGVSSPTLSRNLDRISSASADQCLSDQSQDIQMNLKKRGLWPKSQMLLIDPTDEPYFGTYINQCDNWGLVGQQNTYKRVFKENVIYASPTQLFMNNAPMFIHPKIENCRNIPLWISRVQMVLHSLKALDTKTPLLVGDRAFNDSLGMVYAYFGLYLPETSLQDNPRLLCPAKLGATGREIKWAFLLDKNKPTVQQKTMESSFYDAKYLG